MSAGPLCSNPAVAGEVLAHVEEVSKYRGSFPTFEIASPCSTRANKWREKGHHLQTVSFIRHGQGEHNLAAIKAGHGCTCDQSDPSVAAQCPYLDMGLIDAQLTETGRQQARRLQQQIAMFAADTTTADVTPSQQSLPRPVQAIVTSPLRRATQTALLAFEKHAHLPVVAVEHCREHSGTHACDKRLTVSELAKQFPRVDYSDIATDHDELWTQEREPRRGVILRGYQLLQFIRQRFDGRHVAVATHSSFLLTLFNVAFDAGDESALQRWFETGEMRTVVINWTTSQPASS